MMTALAVLGIAGAVMQLALVMVPRSGMLLLLLPHILTVAELLGHVFEVSYS